ARGVAAELGFSSFEMAPDEALVSERLSQAFGREARLLIDSYRLDEAGLASLARWPAAWAVYDDFFQFGYAGCSLAINTRISAVGASYQARQVALGPRYFPA